MKTFGPGDAIDAEDEADREIDSALIGGAVGLVTDSALAGAVVGGLLGGSLLGGVVGGLLGDGLDGSLDD